MKKVIIWCITTTLTCVALAMSPVATAADADSAEMIEKGRKLAFSRKGGNCLACHQMEGADQPGTIGPPLVAMKYRFPDREKLRERIWDATALKPTTQMPPFGKNLILTEEEIDQVVAFVSTL